MQIYSSLLFNGKVESRIVGGQKWGGGLTVSDPPQGSSHLLQNTPSFKNAIFTYLIRKKMREIVARMATIRTALMRVNGKQRYKEFAKSKKKT